MSFLWPWLLVLLLAVPGVVLAHRHGLRRREQRRAELGQLGIAVTERRPRWPHLPIILLAAALTIGVIAVARPRAELPDPRREGTVILAFDTSASMAAGDIAPTRLAAAQAAAREFVSGKPDTVKIGVVTFGGAALVVQQPTEDAAAVLAAIDRLRPGGGTALGGGMLTALSAIAGKAITPGNSAETGGQPSNVGYYGGTSVILLTDGENTDRAPDPQAMAELSSVAGVKVFPIGLGSAAGSTIQVEGYTLATRLDEATLQQIATTTGGTYHNATDAASLTAVYSSISRTWTSRTIPYEITSWFALAAVLLLSAAVTVGVLRTGRVLG